MIPAGLPFLEEMSEADRLHFRNLALIRPQIPSPSQLQLIEGLARSVSHPRLLTLMARTAHWLANGPILYALAQNESTPEPIRRDLELAVSLVDLMHGMDKAPPDEREERAQAAQDVYAQLPGHLKPIVKQHLKQLARQVNPTGATQEMPPLPPEGEDWTALTEPPISDALVLSPRMSLEELTGLAAGTHDPDELRGYLLASEAEIRAAALRNPILNEEILIGVLPGATEASLFEEVYGEARWYFRDPVRRAMYDAPGCPTALGVKLRQAWDLMEVLDRSLHGQPNLRRIACLFIQLDETEYQFVTLWAKRHAPTLLRVVKIFYDRLQRRRANRAAGLVGRQGEARWASLEERVFLANQATQHEQLVLALKDPDIQVFRVVLENPGLTPRELLAAVPTLGRERVEALARHRTWGELKVVREALLHNVHLPLHLALDLLKDLSTPKALLELLRDTRLPYVEVQVRALDMLREAFHALGLEERTLLMRTHGGDLIRHLAGEVLRDEAMLSLLLSDRQLDPNILLRLARNKQTPRAVLDRIAGHPTLMAHSAIMSELLLNPKTPRESAIRVWGLLSESEQQALLRSPHLPATLRYLGA